MKKTVKPPITIIGAGLTGVFFAILLAQKNHTVVIYEKMTEEELRNAASKKSFNLTFYKYALDVFKKYGLWDSVAKVARPLTGTVTFIGAKQNSNPVESWYDNTVVPCYVVQRSQLMKTLIDYAQKIPNVTIHFAHKLVGVDETMKSITIEQTKNKKIKKLKCSVLFGADGLHSAVRTEIQRNQKSSHQEYRLSWSYKQVLFSSEMALAIGMEKEAMYAWTRHDGSFVALPNGDGSYNAMLVTPSDGATALSRLTDDTAIESFIIQKFPHFIPALEPIKQALHTHPESYLTAVNTTPWYLDNFMCILGDAAHALYPFSGQGMSAGFTDSILLISLIETHDEDWHTIFREFQTKRKPHTDALVKLSKLSFELFRREKKADYNAIYDKLTSIVHSVAPRLVKPSVHFRVMENPEHTAEYFAEHEKQRKTILYTGITIGATILTALFSCIALLARDTSNRSK